MSNTTPLSNAELREALYPFGNAAQIVGTKRVELYDVVRSLITSQKAIWERAAFKRGQRVGQYQAADKLYQTIPTLWLFKDGKYPDQLKMNLERTDELLKNCEKFLNHNARVYREYIAQLSTEEEK